jgi:outer membrane protein assembly factor BamB
MRTLVLFLFLQLSASAADWPQFRGPGGRSIGEGSPPIGFGPKTNVIWSRAVAAGSSSPIIWSEKLFLTGFESGELKTFCFSIGTGEKLWERTAAAAKIEPSHAFTGPAAPTPATDGQHLFVYFGSIGLIAYTLDGEERWRKELPMPVVEFGAASSPIIVDDKVVVLCDQDLNSFLLALDRTTGKEVWKAERPEFRRGFATPYLWKHAQGAEIIVPGSIWLAAYDPSTGAERWRYEGTSRVGTSSPAASETMLLTASWNIGADPGSRITMPSFASFAEKNDKNGDHLITKEEIPDTSIRDRFPQMDLDKDGVTTEKEWELFREMFDKAGNAVLAIRPGGRGLVNKTHLAWRSTRSLPYVSSPLYYQGRLHTVKNGGLGSCYDAETGAVHYQDERLGALGDYYSSAVAAAGRVYIASQQGMVVVLRASDALDILARNKLEEEVFATPAIAKSRLYYRTKSHLYCFGTD